MSKPPSDATLLRAAKRELRVLRENFLANKRLLDHYRARASTAEAEVAEWKARFDQLLKVAGTKPEVKA
jgi:hypothetical protein